MSKRRSNTMQHGWLCAGMLLLALTGCEIDTSNIPVGVRTPTPDGEVPDGGGCDAGVGPACEAPECTGANGSVCGTARICVDQQCVMSRCGDGFLDERSETCEGNSGGCEGCQLECDADADCTAGRDPCAGRFACGSGNRCETRPAIAEGEACEHEGPGLCRGEACAPLCSRQGASAVSCVCTETADCGALVLPELNPEACASYVCVEMSCGLRARDGDGDGHRAAECDADDSSGVTRGNDCDDDDAQRFPGNWDGPSDPQDGDRPNRCDGEDNDCSGRDDDSVIELEGGLVSTCLCRAGQETSCVDDDEGRVIAGLTSEGLGQCEPGVRRCPEEEIWGRCEGAVGPAPRDCVSPQDNDCDGMPDDTQVDALCPCRQSETRPCIGAAPGHCEGTRACSDDFTWSACEAPDSCACTPSATRACAGGPNDCAGGTQTCDASGVWGACEGAPELCECEAGDEKPCSAHDGALPCGVVSCSAGAWDDSACADNPVFYQDLDEDGFGTIDATAVVLDACASPIAFGPWVVQGGDCDDGDAAISPGAIELCDADNVDETCDGNSNEGCECVLLPEPEERACENTLGECAAGLELCEAGPSGGSVFSACSVRPAARDACNGLDEDCDDEVDEGGDEDMDACLTLGGGYCVDGACRECTQDDHCDADHGQCDDALLTCSCDDGYEWNGAGCVDINECAAPSPPCVDSELPTCVDFDGGYRCECTVTSCQAIGSCYTASCSAGACIDAQRLEGAPCGSNGMCNAAGVCVGCTMASHCDDESACTANVCMDNECRNPSLCTDPDEPHCDTEDGCVECTNAGHCDDENACTTDSCTPGHTCAHASCAAPNVCASPSTGCVRCTSDAHCNDMDACTTDDCSGTACAYSSACTSERPICASAILGCVECTQDSECDDGDPCTTDDCVGGNTCSNTACSGGNVCGGDLGCVAAETIAQIEAGEESTCVRSFGNELWCWGDDDYGQLGNNAALEDSLVPISIGTTYTDLDIGDFHALAVIPGGQLRGFGNNSSGTIGGASCTSCGTPVAPFADSSFTQVAAGLDHSCGLLSSGQVRCWGDNTAGQLGNDGDTGSTVAQTVVLASGSALTGITQIAAGDSHTCALGSGGALWCWGDDTSGQLGVTNPAACTEERCNVAVPLSIESTAFTRVEAGRAHSCAITSATEVYCWGNNFAGQLGLGDSGTANNRQLPVKIGSFDDVLDIGLGSNHTCALRETGVTPDGEPRGRVYCWGRDNEGQLGLLANASTTFVLTPTVIPSGNLGEAVDVAVGAQHSCALLTRAQGDFQIYCWGRSDNGQVGYNSTSDRDTPIAVTTLP